MMAEKIGDKAKNRKLKKVHILIIILFLNLFAGIFLYFRSNTKNKLRSKIDALRTTGYPVTLKELDQLYSIPDNVENAAGFILDAISYYVDTNDSRVMKIADWKTLSPQEESLSEEIMKHASLNLHENQKSLDLLHKAATMQYCRYPADLSAGQTPKVFDILKMIRLLGVEATVHAENGDSEASVNSLICGLNIADSLSNAPLLVCQLVRMASQDLIISTLEHTVNIIDFNDEQLAQLSKTTADTQRLSGISYGLMGELCDAISEFENYSPYVSLYGEKIPFSNRFLVSIYRGLGLNKSDVIIYLDILNKIIEAGKLPLHERQEAAKKIQNEIANISKIHLVLKTTAPAYPQFISRELTDISKLRAAQTALAVQRYRLKNGKLPDSLSNLVPEYFESVPSDPFDGKELRYKKLDSGFVIYSIDKDLIDDGGQEEPKDKRQKVPHWDITFTIKK